MNYTQPLKHGYVYWLKDYTAPKVFNGLYFECLVTASIYQLGQDRERR